MGSGAVALTLLLVGSFGPILLVGIGTRIAGNRRTQPKRHRVAPSARRWARLWMAVALLLTICAILSVHQHWGGSAAYPSISILLLSWFLTCMLVAGSFDRHGRIF